MTRPGPDALPGDEEKTEFLFADNRLLVQFFGFALVGDAVLFQGVLCGGAFGVRAVVAVDVAHGFHEISAIGTSILRVAADSLFGCFASQILMPRGVFRMYNIDGSLDGSCSDSGDGLSMNSLCTASIRYFWNRIEEVQE